MTEQRAWPTGFCWCGCGKPTNSPKARFLPGHDAQAYSALRERYGGLANVLLAIGFTDQEGATERGRRLGFAHASYFAAQIPFF